jgi:hypothetical protein
MAEPSYPIKKHRAPAPPVATFGDLLRGGGKWAWLYCNSINCSHRVALAFGPFAIRRGLDTPATTIIRERFRCGRCGAKTSTLTLPSVVVKTGRLQKFPPEHALKLLPAHAWLDAMCNLYSLNGTRDEIGKYLKVSHNRMASFEPQLTLFPGSAAPVVRLANDGERELVNLSWGFVLLMDGKAPRRVTNVRDDKIQNSSFWKGSFEERRCLVPATSFSVNGFAKLHHAGRVNMHHAGRFEAHKKDGEPYGFPVINGFLHFTPAAFLIDQVVSTSPVSGSIAASA